ncbi:MAG: aldehyde dehydrogenase family protein, partial [Pseudomonadota bacterium]|nr:aldehyde dehydrogenase family protein [Pseudomonadota bacterium]
MSKAITSIEPATGTKIWSGKPGDAAVEVAAAREALSEWAGHSPSYRMEALRRFANVVRKKEKEFATLIARETGKPFWEAQTEVTAVINKVEISISAYAERTPKLTIEAAIGNKVLV